MPASALVRRVFIGLLVANLAVVGVKLAVGITSGSLAVLGSELLVADAAHTRADVFITVGILVGILLTRQGWWWADSAVAIIVALAIVLVAYRILARTVPVLVDQRAIPTRDIQDAAQAVPGVKSAYAI